MQGRRYALALYIGMHWDTSTTSCLLAFLGKGVEVFTDLWVRFHAGLKNNEPMLHKCSISAEQVGRTFASVEEVVSGSANMRQKRCGPAFLVWRLVPPIEGTVLHDLLSWRMREVVSDRLAERPAEPEARQVLHSSRGEKSRLAAPRTREVQCNAVSRRARAYEGLRGLCRRTPTP